MARRKQLGIPGPSHPLQDSEYYASILDDYAATGSWKQALKQAKAIRLDEPDLAALARAFETRGRAIEARLEGKITLATELEAESERHLATYERERLGLDDARHRRTLGNPDEIELSDNEQELLVYLDELERRGLYSDQVLRKGMLTGQPYFYYGVSFNQITPESAEDGDYSDSGWTVEKTEGTLDDVLSDARSYGIQPRGRLDATSWWESDYSQDYRTGEEEQHSLHVDVDVSVSETEDLSPYVFDFINTKLGGKPGDTLSALADRRSVRMAHRRNKVPSANPSTTAKRMMNPRNY
jgi:hypothetical protein